MRRLYNIFLALGFWGTWPISFLKMRQRSHWRSMCSQFFGKFDRKLKQALTNRHVMWIYAGDGSEPGVCTQLIRAVQTRLPNLKLVVSVTTADAMLEFSRRLPSHVSRVYHPIDCRSFVTRAMHVIGPEAIVLLHPDIQPEFLWRARSMRVPTFLVVTKLDQEALGKYRRWGLFYRRFFKWLKGIAVETENEVPALVKLGAAREFISVVGDCGSQAATLHDRRLGNVAAILDQLGVAGLAPIIVAPGVAAGEEGVLGQAFGELQGSFPGLFLVMVPQQVSRGADAGAELRRLGLRCVFRNEITNRARYKPGEVDCLIINTPGDLGNYIDRASLLVLGGTISGHSPQDPLEASAHGKPIVIGPNCGKHKSMAASLVSKEAAAQFSEPEELALLLRDLLADASRREVLGNNAENFFQDKFGAMDRLVEMMIPHLQHEEVYVAPR